MLTFTTLLLLWCMTCYFAYGADDYFVFSAHRDVGDTRPFNSFSNVRSRQSGNVTSMLGKSLYWFGNFSVGDTPSLKLLIDTGSSDLILNPGLYKPSKYEKPYGEGNFSITYEGVNRAGFGFETINGTVTRDKVTAGGLTVLNQAVGNTTSFKYFDVAPLSFANPGQGIIGFLGSRSSFFNPPSPSWFFNLCNDKLISQCKLGLAFGTSGEGLTIIGKVAENLITGGLTTVPRLTKPFGSAYTVKGDVTIDNKIVSKDQNIIMDVGTDNIQGPLGPTKDILNMLGYPTHLAVSGPNKFDPNTTTKVLTGFFPCNKPPMLGFSFPAQSELGNGTTKSKIFNVSPLVWDVYNHGGNNCTSILGGTNALNSGNTTAWLLGQPFFAGHYLNFDITAETVGFGDLLDPSMAGST